MATRIEKAFGVSGDQTSVPTDSAGTEVSFDQGWSNAYELEPTEAGYRYIDRGQHNYLWNVVTGNVKEWQEQDYPTFYEGISYKNGVIVFWPGNGLYYRSKVEGTTDTITDPSSSDEFEVWYGGSVENRIKALQAWNMPENSTDPLISSTPTNYSIGEFPSKDVEVTIASTNLKRVSGVVSSDDNIGVLTVTFKNDNPEISSQNQYVGVVLADGSQAEAGVVSGVSKSGASGADIQCSVDLSVVTGGFKWFFILPIRGKSYEVTDEEASESLFQKVRLESNWVDVTSSRSVSVTYTNNKPVPIEALIRLSGTPNFNTSLAINGLVSSNYNTTGDGGATHSVEIPPGSTYRVTVNAGTTLESWFEK